MKTDSVSSVGQSPAACAPDGTGALSGVAPVALESELRSIADFLARSVQRTNLGPEGGQDYATAFDYELDQAAGALYAICITELPAKPVGNAGVTFSLDDVERIIRLKVAPKRPLTQMAFQELVNDLWDAACAASSIDGVRRKHFAAALLSTGATAPMDAA